MSNSSVEFAGLLCSRLCHDLLSPVGAMMNGLELLADEADPEMRARCMELLADSARASASRLTFYRLAFGASGGLGDVVAATDARAALSGLVATNPRIELVWMVEQAGLPKSAAKILLNLAMVAFDALVRGGRLMVAEERGEIVVRAEGPRIALDADLRTILSGGGDAGAMSARSAGAWLIRQLADEHGRRIELAEEDGVLVVAAILR
jgi:histidine phosphotransferase ChpT